MRRFACVIALAALPAALAPAQTIPDQTKTIGTQMPDVAFTADDDSTFHLSALWGKPVIVSPIFTSCPHTCSMITESLRDALRAIGEPGVGYEVLTISFDPADDTAAMRAYRERLTLPRGWRLVTASASDLATFLGAMDFNVTALEGGGFAHPNLVVVLGPDLRIASYVHGVMYETDDVRAALEDASNRASLVTRFRPVILLVVALGLVAVGWTLYATRRREREA
ncbi:MAG: SCO family protein [Candidatus Latescibacteria bacterium]|nr:SCO family protein [Candidatus Latescibacterota bacterium]